MSEDSATLWVVASVGANVLAWARRNGVDVPAVLREANLDEASFRDATGRIPALDMIALWRALEVRMEDPAFALRSGASASVGVLPLVGPLMASSRTLEQSLASQAQHMALISNATVVAVEATDTRVTWSASWAASLRWPTHVSESSAAFNVAFVDQHASAPVRLESVAFPFPKPGHADAHDLYFGCPVRYAAESLQLTWAEDPVAVEFWTHDAAAWQVLKRAAEGVSAEPPQGTAGRIRSALAKSDRPASLGLSPMARALGVTPRTLQRRLESEGTSFRDVVDGYLRQRALSALRLGDTSIERLSEDLGFSNRSAFHRAFVRWTDATPAAWRSSGGTSDLG